MTTRTTFGKAAAAALLAALAAFALGAATPAWAQAKGKRIAVFVGPTQDKYIGTLSRSLVDNAATHGIAATVFSSPFDPALQAQQIDDAIAQKFDLFVVQTISQKAIAPSLARARAANVPLLLVIVPLAAGAETPAVYVGYEDVTMGRLAGEAMLKALADSGRTKARVAVVAGSMAEGKAPLRDKGFREAFAKKPGFEVVVTEDVRWNPAQAEKAAGQLLARFAGQGGLDGIYGMNDTLANSAIAAAEAAGVKVGSGADQLVVVGGNCQQPGVKNLGAGKMAATVLMLPAEEGKLAAERIRDHFEGKKLVPTEYLPTEIITSANLAKHATACSY
jgi:ribose transport system substrate-binding protein